jgi:hypothetical protein
MMVFSDLTSKLVAMISPVLASKPMMTLSLGLTSKPVVEGFSIYASKPAARFDDYDLKITAMISWFGPQNQVGDGLSIAPKN